MASPHLDTRHQWDWIVWPRVHTVGGGPVTPSASLRMRLKVFRILLLFGSLTLVGIISRALIVTGGVGPSDVLNLVCLALAAVAVHRRPDRLRLYAWAVMLTFWINALDGVLPFDEAAVTPTHLLVPMLVLYGGWMGSPGMIAVSGIGTLSLYVLSALYHAPLAPETEHQLFNLCLLTMVSGLSSLMVLNEHRRTTRLLQERSLQLEKELEQNLRLNAVMFHDLSNPLLALGGGLELSEVEGGASVQEVRGMKRLVRHMHAIMSSVREYNTRGLQDYVSQPVRVRDALDGVMETLEYRLKQKQLQLSLGEGGELQVKVPQDILVHSLLGNLMTNAIKFSPQGETIDVSARRCGDCVRIEVVDQGQGFAAEVLGSGDGRGYRPQVGTQGEVGSGFGLRILALYLDRLQGRLELCNPPHGGGAAALVLPAV